MIQTLTAAPRDAAPASSGARGIARGSAPKPAQSLDPNRSGGHQKFTLDGASPG